MSPIIEQILEPLADEEPHALMRLKRLNVLDWNEIHEHVQAILQQIDQYVCSRTTGPSVIAGSTKSGSSFALFSYRTYQTPDMHIDPVVVALTFQPIPEGIRITGDIAGESLGDVRFQSGPREAVDDHDDILRLASSISDDLVKEAQTVVQALNDTGRQPIA